MWIKKNVIVVGICVLVNYKGFYLPYFSNLSSKIKYFNISQQNALLSSAKMLSKSFELRLIFKSLTF